MFLTVHSTSAIIIGQSVVNPIGAFLIGLISHYILDAIPHGDEEKFKNIGITGMTKLAILDHAGVFLMLASLFLFKPNFIFTLNILIAIIGAMLPDWISAVYKLSAKINLPFFKFLYKITKPIEKFHQFCHRKIIKYESSFKVGVITQIIFLIGFWLMI